MTTRPDVLTLAQAHVYIHSCGPLVIWEDVPVQRQIESVTGARITIGRFGTEVCWEAGHSNYELWCRCGVDFGPLPPTVELDWS